MSNVIIIWMLYVHCIAYMKQSSGGYLFETEFTKYIRYFKNLCIQYSLRPFIVHRAVWLLDTTILKDMKWQYLTFYIFMLWIMKWNHEMDMKMYWLNVTCAFVHFIDFSYSILHTPTGSESGNCIPKYFIIWEMTKQTSSFLQGKISFLDSLMCTHRRDVMKKNSFRRKYWECKML